jgi:Subtilase family
MPDQQPRHPSRFEDVAFSTTEDGLPFAYRPGQVITTQLRKALEVLAEINRRLPSSGGDGPEPDRLEYQKIDSWPGEEADELGGLEEGEPQPEEPPGVNPRWFRADEELDPNDGENDPPSDGLFFLVRGVRDPLRAVLELRLHGIIAQLNYVYFSHQGPFEWPLTSSTADLTASPVYASPVYASPVYASPVYASPVYASPVYASPVYASGASASPVDSTDAVARMSSAVPAERGRTTGSIWDRMADPARLPTRVFVLDTGLAFWRDVSVELRALRASSTCTVRPLRPSDATDRPGSPSGPYLAPAAGHGTFIAGVINQVAPGHRVAVGKVLDNSGAGDEWTIARRIHALARALAGSPDREYSILSLSFGAPVLEHPYLMAQVISDIQSLGVVVVASAGNDAMSRPVFPAALPDVVAVGALGASGPAPFSNYGPWVNACAPGVDLVSTFFTWTPPPVGPPFRGWAIWSGTSFAGPIVAAALARLIGDRAITAREARWRLIDQAWLMRIPDLGTVVNLL